MQSSGIDPRIDAHKTVIMSSHQFSIIIILHRCIIDDDHISLIEHNISTDLLGGIYRFCKHIYMCVCVCLRVQVCKAVE